MKQRHGHPVLEILGSAGAWTPVEGDRDSAGQARRRVLAQVPAGTPVVAVVGLGLGHVLEAIDEIAPAAHVIALELTPALAGISAAVPRVREWAAAGRLTHAVAPAYEALGTAGARAALVRAGASLPLVISPALAAECAGAMATAKNVLRQRLFEAKANEDARRANAGRYLLNTLRNLSAVEREGDVASLANCFAGAPGVVVAAGPTLDDTMEDLRAASARAVIVAVDTSVKPLLAAGITPDLVVAMDPTEQNARHLYDIPDLPNTWLVAEPSVNPAIVRAFSGRSFLLSLGFDPWPWIAESGITRGKLRAWGSVATTAYDLALAIGCSPIGLAGFDFSFPDGRPYCRNTEYEHDWAEAAAWGESIEFIWRNWTQRWRDVTTPDVNGRDVLTAPHLVAFRDWVLKDIERLDGERRIFNAGGGILAGPSVLRGALNEVIPEGFDARRAVPERLRAAHVPPSGASRFNHARRDLIRSLNDSSGEPASDSPVHQWMRFAPSTGFEDIGKALTDSPGDTQRKTPGPHLIPEQTSRLRNMLAGDATAAAPARTVDSETALETCSEVLASVESSVVRYSPRLAEGVSGRVVPASALVEWAGPGYAAVRRLEAILASFPADRESDPFLRGPVEALADLPGARVGVQDAARVAVVRETALAFAAAAPDGSPVADILRVIDPTYGDGDVACEIEVGERRGAASSLRRSDFGRLLTGRLAGTSSTAAVQLAAGTVSVRLSEPPHCRSAVRFLAPDARLIAPRVLRSSAFGAALFGLTFDDQRAVLNPVVASTSAFVHEDGTFEPMHAWPHPIIGEIPAGDGAWVAWSNVKAEPLLMRRTSDGVVDIVESAPFRPNRVVEWDDEFLCTAHDGGLWLWTPGHAPRKVAEAPPTLSLVKSPDGVRLDPVVRSAEGFTTRTRLDHAWLWQPGAGLTRLPLGSGGPCWSVAAAGGWIARAHPHDDLVTLTHESGRVVDLACYYPVTLAWAGRSLIVLSSTGGTILLFENLRDALT